MKKYDKIVQDSREGGTKMKSDRTFKVVAVIALLVAVIGLTIGYAAYTETLTIDGSAKVTPATWDVKFKNLGTTEKTGDATSTDPTLTDTTISGFVATLTMPGDSVKYKFDIANDGTIDAKLTTFTMGTLSCAPSSGSAATQEQATAVCAELSYTLEYGSPLTTPAVNDTLAKETSKSAELTLTWDSNGVAEPDGNIDVTVGTTTLIYSQD